MMQKTLYSLTALFDSPGEIIQAAEKTNKAGYTKYDVHTPYPVHGMDHAMHLKTSKIGYFAFAFGEERAEQPLAKVEAVRSGNVISITGDRRGAV